MVVVFSGNKEEINRCKTAIILANGDFGVTVEEMSLTREKWFRYRLEVKLRGPEKNKNRFLRRISANYDVLNGNMLGLLEYL